MLRKEMLIRLKMERKPHLLEQWRNRGILGKVPMNRKGKYVYSLLHLAKAKKHMLTLAELREYNEN